MADAPIITDDEIIAGWRPEGSGAPEVRIRKRRRLRPTAGLTGSYFERVKLEVDGRKVNAILKLGALAFGPPTRERMFFERFAGEVPMRVPRGYAVGQAIDGADGWVLMEALPKGKRLIDWTPEETRASLRNLAALHATYLGSSPAVLARPFTADVERTLSFVAEGVRKLRERYEELPYLPRVASDRALELVAKLAKRPEIFREAFASSPETMLHGDYHRGNFIARDGEPHIVFDWQFVCAGPPAYDLAVFWLYLGAVNKPGLFGFFDRMELRDREMSWPEIIDVYGAALLRLRPDADIAAIASCADAAIACETVRQLTYFGHGLETFIGPFRFIYRDHRTIGGFIARWIGVEDGWKLYTAVFEDFEQRAERLIAARELA